MRRAIVGLVLLVLLAATLSAWPANQAPVKLAPFAERKARVIECLEQQQVGVQGMALYDAQGRPVMTQDGRHAVQVVLTDLAPSVANQ